MMGFLILLALLFLPIALYLVFGIGTFFKRFYRDVNDRAAKSYFQLSFFLPIAWGILLFAAYVIFGRGQNISRCIHNTASFFDRYINLQTLIPVGFLILASIPFLYGALGFYWAYKAVGDTRKIYRRGVIVVLAGALSALMPIFFSASLTVTRDKGVDAAVKGNLAGLRTQMALYFDEYGGEYPVVSGQTRNERWNNMWREAFHNDDAPNSPCYTSTKDDYFQYDYRSSLDGASWVADAPLRYPQERDGVKQDFWCVDFTGVARAVIGKEIKDFNCPN